MRDNSGKKFLGAIMLLELARLSRLKGKKNVQKAANLLIVAGVSAKEFNTFVNGLKEGRGKDRVCTNKGCIIDEIWRDWSFLDAVLRVLEEKGGFT